MSSRPGRIRCAIIVAVIALASMGAKSIHEALQRVQLLSVDQP